MTADEATLRWRAQNPVEGHVRLVADNTILDEAKRLVQGDRQDAYSHPAEDFARTALMWSAILGSEVTAKQVALCMAALKLSRECHRHAVDNLVDAAGYVLTAQMVEDAQ